MYRVYIALCIFCEISSVYSLHSVSSVFGVHNMYSIKYLQFIHNVYRKTHLLLISAFTDGSDVFRLHFKFMDINPDHVMQISLFGYTHTQEPYLYNRDCWSNHSFFLEEGGGG